MFIVVSFRGFLRPHFVGWRRAAAPYMWGAAELLCKTIKEHPMGPAEKKPESEPASETTPRELSPAAQRALAEAEERRRQREAQSSEPPKEINGRGGLDPARYGDWEVKGIISDF